MDGHYAFVWIVLNKVFVHEPACLSALSNLEILQAFEDLGWVTQVPSEAILMQNKAIYKGQHASRPLSPASGRPLTPTGLTARSQANRGPPSNSRPPPAGQRPGSPSSGQMQNTSRGPRPESPATRSGRPPHPLSKMQKEDDIEFHAM